MDNNRDIVVVSSTNMTWRVSTNTNDRNLNILPITQPSEPDWRQQQFQRQRMQLLSMAILLCFMVLFFDDRAGAEHHEAMKRARMEHRLGMQNKFAISPNLVNDTEKEQRINQLEDIIEHQPGYISSLPGENVSGIYSGEWTAYTQVEYFRNKPVYHDLIPYLQLDRDIQKQEFVQPEDTGHSWLFLKMKPPAWNELSSDVAYATGQLVLYQDKTSLTATIVPVQGVFLRKTGNLTLFGNSPDSSVQLLYRKPQTDIRNSSVPATSSIANDGNMSTSPSAFEPNGQKVLGIPIIPDRADYEAVEISPPRPTYISRFRNSDSFSDQCVSIIQLQVNHSTSASGEMDIQDTNLKPNDKTEPGLRLEGTLASVNCGLYLQLNVIFLEENLNTFFTKATRYAVLMTFISMAEIYVLLRQLQLTGTQATAAKVSLVTIGQQAIIDSYLCLGHLTVGIVAQNVFSAFASVAFVKLIIFSVFEMRYLLIIWKARRPQGFSEGWLVLRRELTSLYSRFYLSLLSGLFIFYNFSSHLPTLIFICYSFWVPQIVHNVQREVRSPFDPVYLYGISALRMFLPLYFYGCPENFLTAFPMIQTHPNPNICYVLLVWMTLQVAILSLQQFLGPRFFIPARFLPVKYNYERRIQLQELTLLRNSPNGPGKSTVDEDNSIDCVICMVEIDLDARDYMIAPCDHIFHRECLQGWMQVKMECPTCRCVLPEP